MSVPFDTLGGWFFPENALQWTELLAGSGLYNPLAAWGLQEPAGNFADMMGNGFTLTNAAMTYQQAIPGMTRKGIAAGDGGGAGAASVVAGIGDSYAFSHTLLAFIQVTAAGGDRDMFGFGGGAAYRNVLATSTLKLKVGTLGGGGTQTGLTDPDLATTARPVILRVDRAAGSLSIFTEKEKVLQVPYVAPTPTSPLLVLGAANLPTPAMKIAYSACWRGGAAEMGDTQIATLFNRLKYGPTVSFKPGGIPLTLATRGFVGAGSGIKILSPSGVASITSGALDRFSPVVVRLTMGAGSLPWIVLAGSSFDERLIFWPTRPAQANQSGDQRWTPMFRDRSSLVQEGNDLVATILPNGGWWRENFKLIFIAGTEMTQS